MRFNSEAYDKLFPREADPAPVVETPVETFRPSQNEVPDKPVPDDLVPEETEVNDDDGSDCQSDSE